MLETTARAHKNSSLTVWHYRTRFNEDPPILLFQLQSLLFAFVKILSTKGKTSRSCPNTDIFTYICSTKPLSSMNQRSDLFFSGFELKISTFCCRQKKESSNKKKRKQKGIKHGRKKCNKNGEFKQVQTNNMNKASWLERKTGEQI
ncbi:hypothetical protein V6Z12_D12G256600 [Gossypium hirsutum]